MRTAPERWSAKGQQEGAPLSVCPCPLSACLESEGMKEETGLGLDRALPVDGSGGSPVKLVSFD